jgi:hypothetical protein
MGTDFFGVVANEIDFFGVSGANNDGAAVTVLGSATGIDIVLADSDDVRWSPSD